MSLRKFSVEPIDLVVGTAAYYHIELFGRKITFQTRSGGFGFGFGQRVCIYLPQPGCSLFCGCQHCRIDAAIRSVCKEHNVDLYGVETGTELSVKSDEMQLTADTAANVIRIHLMGKVIPSETI